MKDQWLPFDGIQQLRNGGLWFNKTRFTKGVPKVLERWGTGKLKRISERLTGLDIPPGKTIDDVSTINRWLDTPETLKLVPDLPQKAMDRARLAEPRYVEDEYGVVLDVQPPIQ